jgi:hypothetical protein
LIRIRVLSEIEIRIAAGGSEITRPASRFPDRVEFSGAIDDVSIADLDVIRFLVDCEHDGIEVLSPPLFIQE